MLKRNIVPILILLLICFFMINPETVSEGAFNGLQIWVNNIVPYLFFMSVLSNILLQYNFLYSLFERISFISEKLFKSRYALIPFFISFVSGYPSGAMAVNTMVSNRRINENEANYLTLFTNNCSFQFAAGAIAFSMLRSFSLVKYIAVPHIIGAVILSFLIRGQVDINYSKPLRLKPVPFHSAFSTAVYKSVIGILSVGGVIVIFSVFSRLLNDGLSSVARLIPISSGVRDIIYSLLAGSLEITNGCSIISKSEFVPLKIKLLIINFLMSFSGMSVMFQTVAVTDSFNLNIKNYMLYKLVHGIISSILCIAMLRFI